MLVLQGCQGKETMEIIYDELFEKIWNKYFDKLFRYFLDQTQSFGRDDDLAYELTTETILDLMKAIDRGKVKKSRVYYAIKKRRYYTAMDFHSSTREGRGKLKYRDTCLESEIETTNPRKLESLAPVVGKNRFSFGWEKDIEANIDRERVTNKASNKVKEAIDLLETGCSLNNISRNIHMRKCDLSKSLKSVYREYVDLALI